MRASLESEKNIISSGVFLLIVGLFKNKLVDDKKKKNGGSISELTILELLLVLKIWSTINLQEREKWKENSLITDGAQLYWCTSEQSFV